MPIIQHNPEKLYPQYQNYSHAVEVSSGSCLDDKTVSIDRMQLAVSLQCDNAPARLWHSNYNSRRQQIAPVI